MTDKQLTEAEAQEFLTLLEKVESDMDRAFSAASEQVFGEEDGNESFKEQWGAPVSTVYGQRPHPTSLTLTGSLVEGGACP